ncbi:MAG: hypothetical protein H6513_03670 [Acidimicrobiaceae bacterium]|nr:hypothetical protein [Ilumatobacter sp.]MCB9379774.1 hypothetical protein [Acidimicrobiaceae bacterium]MCO5328994.1 hypothetical protein [Ilumatobacteraceae bacterium]
MTRRTLTPLLLVALLAACGGDDTATTTDAPTSTEAATTTSGAATTTEAPTTTGAPSTTVDPAAAATAYEEPGPYPVGVTTVQLAKGPLVEVWYPAVDGSDGTETYDMRDYVPDGIRALLTADIPAGATYAATRDAALADGRFPVVLFSHGFSGVRVQSTFLTSHLASWGMIVVSPEHPSRDLTNVLGGTATGDRADSVDDLLSSLDLILGANDDAASPFAGHVDGERVVAVGHSAGGGTIVGAAADPRVDGYVSLASGVFGGDADLPAVPSFFIAGSADGVVSAEDVTRPAYEAAPSPSLLWIIDGVGHNGFDDFCTFGNGAGIIGLAEASGLGPLLEAQPNLRSLGSDGCLPPARPVDTTFPLIRHAVTAWVRALFGEDPTPVGLGPDAAAALAVPTEIAEK